MPLPDIVGDLAAYSLQIACIALLAEIMSRIVPVRSAGFGYAYWRMVLVAALVMPWIWRAGARAVLVNVGEPIATTSAAMPFIELPPTTTAWIESSASWSSVAPWILAAGMAMRLLWVAIGIARLRRLRGAGTPVADPMYDDLQQLLGTRAELRTVPGLAQPVTFGLWRPVVLVPDHFDASPEAIRRAAVTHELFHVQRRDWLAVMAEEAARAVFWFHPAIWWMTSRIQQAREEFTDHLAVLATGSRRAYIDALLAFADGPSLAPAPAFARRPHLFHRIVLLSKENIMSSRRIVISGAAMAALLVAGGWYASEAFPVEQAASPFAPTPAAAPPAQLPAVPGGQINPVTPENPIPRRLFSTVVPYPASMVGSGYSAIVEVRVVLDASGSVSSVGRGAVSLSRLPPTPAAATQTMDAFADAAAAAIQQWRYDAPANAPLAFYVRVTFSPTGESRAVQADAPRGGSGLGAGAITGGGGTASVAPADGGPVRVGGGVRAPVQLSKVNPVYPPIALSARVQGVVILELTLDAQGFVTDARVLRSIPLLDQAAIDAVRQWQYAPTLLNGVPVPIVMTATVQFTLPEVTQF
jgi:protein TonB